MKKVSIQFNSTMVENDVINIVGGSNNFAVTGRVSDDGFSGTFIIGSSATESATNLAAVISAYNVATSSLGPIAVENYNEFVDITFLDNSITTASAPYYGASSVITVVVSDVDEDTFSYGSQVLTRSPHYFDVEAPDLQNIDSAELHLFIYQGTRFTDRPLVPTYVVRSSAVLANSSKMTFNISEFARSFTSNSLPQSGNRATWSPFIDIFPFYTRQGVVSALPPKLAIGYHGYGYFEDGYNPQFDSGILQSNRTIVTREGSGFAVPIDADKVSKVVFEKDGETVKVGSVNNNITFSTLAINYFSSGNYKGDYQKRLDDTYMEESYNEAAIDRFYSETSNTYADTAYVEMLDGTTEVIKVRYIQECKFDPIQLTFMNKFGALQSIWFFKTSSVSMKTKDDSFRRNTTSLANGAGQLPLGYRLEDHQTKNLYKSGKETIKLNSGFYPEEYNEVFKQMMLSEDSWITYKGNVLPVNISDSNISFKTSINEKLIEYSIKCDFAFDTINSIN
jgi:hypothetical protein